jgi:hypothetical protein
MPAAPPTPGTDPSTDPSTDDAHADHDTGNAPTPSDHTTNLVTVVDDTTTPHRHTICPARADATDLLTTWLTVDETIVCDLDDWR